MFVFEQPAKTLKQAAELSRTKFFWYIYGGNDYTEFNFDFVPVPWEEHQVHVFPSQWQRCGDVFLANKYNVETPEWNFRTDHGVQRLPDPANWYIPDHVDASSVDFTWHPDSMDPAMNYHFETKWHWDRIGGPEYRMPGATDIKYLDCVVAETKSNPDYWFIPDNIDPASIDYSWCPNPADPPLNYHFPVAWGWENIGGPEYRVPGAKEEKYIDDFVARTLADMEHWVVPDNVDPDSFDFSWRPNPTEEPYIYKFPTVWNPVGGPEYHVPGAVQEKFIDVQRARTLVDMSNWTVPEELDATEIDFSWVPHPQDPPYVYHFGTEYQKNSGLIYTIPGATEIKLLDEIPTVHAHASAIKVLDIFFVDRMNAMSAMRFEKLAEKYPGIQKIRYANSMMETVKRCVARAKTTKFWVISSENDYVDFDFAWHAETWQGYMTHVFGSQWNKWSDTFLINKWEFERNSKWARGIEEFPNLNFVTNQLVRTSDDANNIYYVDWGNPESQEQLDKLKAKYPNIKSTRYVDNYLDTFKRIMSTATSEHAWIINSIVDYSKFDFSWQPEPWQAEMIHVFPTGFTERGDTFYIHVESFKQQMVELEMLDWFNVINYCKDQRAYRWPVPMHYYQTDDLIAEIKNYRFEYPYAIFSNYTDKYHYDMCLWSKKDRVVEGLSKSGSVSVIPRDVKSDLRTQIYDYPYVNTKKDDIIADDLLDVIFISNGEPMAEENWKNLLEICPRAKRSDGVTGREAAYKAAAQMSDTPWFFAVFAKTEVLPEFTFEFQPDYWQGPKHYIFHSRNALNGLEYGAMNINLYNKQLVLDTKPGLDFTLSAAHEVVPICASISRFNTDPWITWRSAFREVLKLKLEVEQGATLEIKHRLKVWCTKAEGDNAEYCLAGANDALEYYQSVNGDYDKLKLSFDWAWLQDYYEAKYNQRPWEN